MKITILTIGKFKSSPLKPLFETYQKRLERPAELIELEASSKQEESELLLKKLPTGSYVIALDEKGKELSSPEFSKKLESLQVEGASHFTFLIGGAEGHTSDLKNKANLLLSLGKMTWPHMIVRLLLLEQIYRAQQIIKGHPYHKV